MTNLLGQESVDVLWERPSNAELAGAFEKSEFA